MQDNPKIFEGARFNFYKFQILEKFIEKVCSKVSENWILKKAPIPG
jgi:hypothetical protein